MEQFQETKAGIGQNMQECRAVTMFENRFISIAL